MFTKLLKFGFLIAIFAANIGFLGHYLQHPEISVVPFKLAESVNASESGAPVRIDIPSISLSADVENVGMLADGSMGSPKYPDHAGWLNSGVAPGDIGTAVMDGHVNWWNGADTAFAKLHAIESGEKIIVRNNRGDYNYFVVREIKKFMANADAASVFGSGDGKSHLNLITCSGSWDRVAKQFSERLVVFADREE